MITFLAMTILHGLPVQVYHALITWLATIPMDNVIPQQENAPAMTSMQDLLV